MPDVYVPERRIDGRPVEQITAFLFHAGGHEDPMLLRANARQSFQGHILLGMGFTFDDTDKKGVASPLAERERLIAANPRNAEVIQPYVGGKETNSSPTHDHHRYVINFRDWPLRKRDTAGTWKEAGEELRQKWLRAGVVPLDYPGSVAADWDELLTIVEKNVKPQRQALPPKNSINLAAARNWWRFLAYRQGLQAAIRGLDRVLARSRVGPYAALAFLPGRMVYAESAVVFPFATLAAFSALQSRVHEVWARFFGSTLRDDPRYTPSSCFETFPFPEDWTTRADLEAAGREYYEHRADLMIRSNKGMTATYNRFHDPAENDPSILRLRELHGEMDRAVLAAYGWSDIPKDCEFLLDYEEEEDPKGKRRKKLPWRYRWPDKVHDEILGRLLDLNARRAAEERDVAAGARKAASGSRRKGKR